MSTKLKRGFTLIEIVIVLAIAALIMVVVFLAVQGAQRGQRDQQRKDLAARALSKFEEYKGNNNGSVPTTNELQAYFTAGELGTIGSTSATVSVGSAPSCSGATFEAVVVAGVPDKGTICLEANNALYQTNR